MVKRKTRKAPAKKSAPPKSTIILQYQNSDTLRKTIQDEATKMKVNKVHTDGKEAR